MLYFLLIAAIVTSCQSEPDTENRAFSWQEICGREGHSPIYRVKVPEGWKRRDPQGSLADTMKPICEFLIDDAIRITIHNFPSERIEERISPQAQVMRWKKQFDVLDPLHTSVGGQSFSGFSGLCFKGRGQMEGKPLQMLGWSMQIAPEHYLILSEPSIKCRQMRADFTIKALGPKSLMQKHENEILQFAQSFELIEEIPSRT